MWTPIHRRPPNTESVGKLFEHIECLSCFFLLFDFLSAFFSSLTFFSSRLPFFRPPRVLTQTHTHFSIAILLHTWKTCLAYYGVGKEDSHIRQAKTNNAEDVCVCGLGRGCAEAATTERRRQEMTVSMAKKKPSWHRSYGWNAYYTHSLTRSHTHSRTHTHSHEHISQNGKTEWNEPTERAKRNEFSRKLVGNRFIFILFSLLRFSGVVLSTSSSSSSSLVRCRWWCWHVCDAFRHVLPVIKTHFPSCHFCKRSEFPMYIHREGERSRRHKKKK